VKLLEETPVIAKPTRVERPQSRAQGAPAGDTHREVIRLFKLLADATRLRILDLLIQADEHHVRALCELLGQSQPAVSHHLALLRTAGMIECRRQGKHNFYRLAPQRFEQLLDRVFADKKVQGRRIRVGKYVLTCEE
jgi:ArsR family transcriptional regulator